MTEYVRTLETLELVGGALCLDFVNTINSRIHPEHDYLTQYADLLGWANKAGLLSPAQVNELQKRARQNRSEAEKALNAALTLRDLLYRLLSAAASGSKPIKKDMEGFIVLYGETIAHGQFVKTGNHYQTTWNVIEAFEALLWPIIHSAGTLLLSEELGQVKGCPGCGWVFLDTSKNQSRRWCSMETCGARDKMRRYHKKQRSR